MDKIQTLSELLETNIVEIPIVQRDYAQGRKDEHATLVRSNLLSDIKDAVLGVTTTLDLNFVYGKEVTGKFIPLDGQQRLTTLFLLHLFAFKNEDSFSETLQKFTYETRKSSRDFFEALIQNRREALSSNGKVSSIILDSEWFITEWENDPTVQSALVVLDEIVKMFSDVDNLSKRLIQKEDKPLVFQFLKMDDLGMEDSLYIKLNARGKPLTAFENFKARLFARLSDIDKEKSNDFEALFDGKWTDFFWKEFKDNFDEGFLNFFQVLFTNNSVINVPSSNWANRFEFEKLEEEIFINIYDILNAVGNDSYPKLGELIVAGVKESSNYSDRLLFHAVTQYVKVSKGIIDESFDSWIRVASNLILNSQIDDTRTNTAAINGLNELSSHCLDIINYLAIDGKINGFAREQSKEELNKAKIIYTTPSNADFIYDAEQNDYFTGTIRAALNYSYKDGIFEKESFELYWRKISKLFDEKQSKYGNLLRRALLCFQDYTLEISKFNTLCIDDPKEGSSTYSLKRLFSDSPSKIKRFLDTLLLDEPIKEQMEEMINSSLIEENDWRYCFINYPELFSKMSKNHLRLYFSKYPKDRILLVSNKWTNGYNMDLYLSTLSIELEKKGITAITYHEIGTDGDIWLQHDEAEIRYESGQFMIKYKENNYVTKTEKHITEAVDLMLDIFPQTSKKKK